MTRPACGTTAGYKHHLKRKEGACKACREANAKKSRDFRRLGSGGTLPDRDNGRRSLEAQFEPAMTAGDWAAANGYDAATRSYYGEGAA